MTRPLAGELLRRWPPIVLATAVLLVLAAWLLTADDLSGVLDAGS